MVSPADLVRMYQGKARDIKVVEQGPWTITQRDFATRRTVLKHIPTGTHWALTEHRSGSYCTDYHYVDPTVVRVEERTETVKVWTPAGN